MVGLIRAKSLGQTFQKAAMPETVSAVVKITLIGPVKAFKTCRTTFTSSLILALVKLCDHRDYPDNGVGGSAAGWSRNVFDSREPTDVESSRSPAVRSIASGLGRSRPD